MKEFKRNIIEAMRSGFYWEAYIWSDYFNCYVQIVPNKEFKTPLSAEVFGLEWCGINSNFSA